MSDDVEPAARLRFPSIEGLRALESAARLGSFDRAGAELAITASAVSKRVAALEELLGSPVFQRGAKALQLTASGRDYLQQVGPALALLAAAPQHRRAQQRLHKLRICAPPTFARQVLVPALQSYTQLHPAVELEVVLSIPFVDHGALESDVEVRHGEPGEQPVLMHDRVLPMAAPALLRSLPPLRVPADLAQAPLLRTPIEPWAPWFRAAGLAWPEPTQGPRLVDLGLTLEAALCGQGVALGRPTLTSNALRTGSLRPLFNVVTAPLRQYHLLPCDTEGPAAEFSRWLQHRCSALQQEADAALAEAFSRQT